MKVFCLDKEKNFTNFLELIFVDYDEHELVSRNEWDDYSFFLDTFIPDLVLLDVKMLIEDEKSCQILVEKLKILPTKLYLTGFADELDALMRQIPVENKLLKPIPALGLVEKLQEMLQ